MLKFFKNNKKRKVKETIVTPRVNAPMSVDDFVRSTFLTLTSNTYPYGFESDLAGEMIKLKLFPEDIQRDKHGNYFYKIGESRTMFTSHLDTACKDAKPVTHVFDKNYIKTNGDTILGADDKAGVTIMLYMIKNKIPGLYYFFIGEEVGCIGSGLAAKYLVFKGKYDRCISFDRRGTDSVITYQSSSRCCSDEFADQLAKELNKSEGMDYKKDDTGVYTDSAEFTSDIPECTNISVGYYKEHTTDESQDIEHLTKLTEACLVVEWETLVTKRDPSKTEYKSWSYQYNKSSYSTSSYNSTKSRTSGSWRDREYDYGFWGGEYSDPKVEKKDLDKTYGYHDDFYQENESKKTRRGGKKKGKSFYDNGGELVSMEQEFDMSFVNDKSSHKTSIYEWIKFKFLNDRISKAELEIVKEQYLDMNDESDRKFYEVIRSYVVQLR